jgi:hypothetical protein
VRAAEYVPGYGGPELPDDAYVMRGGMMTLENLRTNAEAHFDEFGEYGLSVFSVPGMSVQELALLANRPNRTMRVSTCARIRAVGYLIVRSEEEGGPGHADIKLPEEPTDEILQVIADVFDDPEPNPAALT